MSLFYHMLGHERQIIQNRLRNEIFCEVSTFYVATLSRDKSFILMMKIVVVLFNGIMTSDKSAVMSWVNNVSYKIHCVAYIC